MTGLLATLVPAGVHAVEAFADVEGSALFPEEEAWIARSVPKRRREFTTARVCARAALAGIGVAPAPILPGLRGAPGWPAGVVGSMTHCDGYRAGAVAHRGRILTIGIDAEPAAVLPAGVLDAIALPEEQRMVARLSRSDPQTCWDRLLFSAKEAVYKAWFPLTSTWLDFSQARIEIDPNGGIFGATLLVPGPVVNGAPLREFDGRWLHRAGLVLTAIVVPRAA